MTNANYVPLQGYEPADAKTNTFGRLFGYEVTADDGENVGKIDNVWMDDSGKQGFVAITSGWLFGRQCLIPADSLQVDHDARRARIPYSKDKVKQSPNVAEDYEVTSDEARQVRAYYGLGSTDSAKMATQSGTMRDRVVQDEITRDNGGTISDATATTRTTVNKAMTDQPAMPKRTDGDTTEIRLAEEQVNVGKRQVESGRVRLRKVIRTETVMQPVELHHEDVVVERIEASGTATGDEFKEDSIEIPLMREEAVVEKTTNVTGAVRVRKTSEAEQQNVSTTVRKEDVEVDRDVEVDKTRVTRDNGSTTGSKPGKG